MTFLAASALYCAIAQRLAGKICQAMCLSMSNFENGEM
jgi:hypothetical protein